MTHEALTKYLLAKSGAFIDYPCGDDVGVFKVGKKMFALIGFRDKQMTINLKCDPDEASYIEPAHKLYLSNYKHIIYFFWCNNARKSAQ